MLWAEHVTKNTARSRDDVFDEVRQHFNDAELVDLTLVCGLFNMFNRFMDSLHIPIEDQGEVDKIKRSVGLDPERVTEFMRTVADNWPKAPNGAETGEEGD